MTNQGNRGVAAAAITAAVAVVGLSVVAGRASTAGRLAAVCAVTGFTVAPAAETITALAPASGLSPKTGLAAAAAAVCGSALALARRRPGRPEGDLPPGTGGPDWGRGARRAAGHAERLGPDRRGRHRGARPGPGPRAGAPQVRRSQGHGGTWVSCSATADGHALAADPLIFREFGFPEPGALAPSLSE